MPGLDLDEFRGNRLSFPPAAAASEARRMSDYTIHGELMEGIEGHGITKVEPMKKVLHSVVIVEICLRFQLSS